VEDYTLELITILKSLGIFKKIGNLKTEYSKVGMKLPACLIYEGDEEFTETQSKSVNSIRRLDLYIYANEKNQKNITNSVINKLKTTTTLNNSVSLLLIDNLLLGKIESTKVNRLEAGIYQDKLSIRILELSVYVKGC